MREYGCLLTRILPYFYTFYAVVARRERNQRSRPSSLPLENFIWPTKRINHKVHGSSRKVFLKISQNSQEKNCGRVSFLLKKSIKKETVAQVFSCEFYEILKSTFLYRTSLVAASGYSYFLVSIDHCTQVENFRDIFLIVRVNYSCTTCEESALK